MGVVFGMQLRYSTLITEIKMFAMAVSLHQEGRIAQAEALYREILSQEPEHLEALNALGLLYVQNGNISEGLFWLSKAEEQEPNHPSVLMNLGLCFLDSEPHRSEQYFLRALPNPAAQSNLARLFFLQNKIPEAMYYIDSLIETENIDFCMSLGEEWKESYPDYTACIFMKIPLASTVSLEQIFSCAQFFIDREEYQNGIIHLEKALSIHPEMYLAHILLGDLYHHSHDYISAIQAYEAAILLDEDHHEAYGKLAYTARSLEKEDIAKEFFLRSLQRKADQPEILHQLASISYEQGTIEEAKSYWYLVLSHDESHIHAAYQLITECFSSFPPNLAEAERLLHRALLYHPNNSSFHNMMGHLFFVHGNIEEALLCYRRTIEHNPHHTSAYHQIARYSSEPCLEHLASWQHMLVHDGLHDDLRSHLAFAIATTYERLHVVDSAFSYFSIANALERKQRVFSLDSVRSYLNKEKHRWNSPPPKQKPTQLLFVVGMMRSGSTLLSQLLATHPHIIGLGETPKLPQLVHAFEDMLGTEEDQFLQIHSSYWEHVHAFASTKKVALDKLLGNFAYIGWIRHIFPEARILHCTRDPIDTCWSIFRHRFVGNHSYAYSLEELGSYYALYHDTMNFWKEQYPESILDVSYEELVQNPIGVCRGIEQFCGLEEASLLQSHETLTSIISTPSGMEARKEVHTQSISRAKEYIHHLEPLITSLGDLASDV